MIMCPRTAITKEIDTRTRSVECKIISSQGAIPDVKSDAPYKVDHPMLKTLSPATLKNTVRNETLAIHVGGSSLVKEITPLADPAGRVIVGSSANICQRAEVPR